MPTYVKWEDGITEEVIEKAEKVLGETPERRKRSLEEIHRLIKEEDGFLPVMEDWFLLIFLRCKKFDVKKAFKTLKNYYQFKSMYSGTITDLMPTHMKRILEMNSLLISPLRNTNGEAVVMYFLGAYDPEIATPYELLAASFAVGEIAINFEVSQICGSTLIFDLTGVTLGQLMKFATPSFCALVVRSIQDRWPYRVNSFHVINQPPYYKVIYELIKIWLSKKLKDRVFIHGENLNHLYEQVPRDVLPEKLGGYLGNEIFENFLSTIYNNESILDVLTKYTYNGVLYGQKTSVYEDS